MATKPTRPRSEGGPLSLSSLPLDIIYKILDQLRPTGSLTTYQSMGRSPEFRNNSHVESRTNYSNVCLVSRTFHGPGTRYLYGHALLKDLKELIRFFRSLACNHNRPLQVRSLAWAGMFTELNDNASIEEDFKQELRPVFDDCWDSIKDTWPRGPVDMETARLLGIDGRHTLCSWRLLGGVLAMCSGLKALFMMQAAVTAPIVVDRNGPPPCPEFDAIWPLIQPDDPTAHNPRPPGLKFLQELEVFILEPHGLFAASWNAECVLVALLQNSPLLRRFEVKFGGSFQAVIDRFHESNDGPLRADLKELLIWRTIQTADSMTALINAFPKLVSLQVEYTDGSDGSDGSHMDAARGFKEAAWALPRLSKTLEILTLTTSPKTYPRVGRWSNYEDYPVCSTLSQMTNLKSLTIESIWLFGRQDPAAALKLPQLLSRSLQKFCLIDYWGDSEPAKFYPEFPNRWSPLQLYAHILSALRDECSIRLPALKEVTVASEHLYSRAGQTIVPSDRNGQGRAAAPYEPFLPMFRRVFGNIGVEFTVITSKDNAALLHASWANVG